MHMGAALGAASIPFYYFDGVSLLACLYNCMILTSTQELEYLWESHKSL